MKPTTRHFDFDPHGRTRLSLADWDRKAEEMSLARVALEAAAAEEKKQRQIKLQQHVVRLPHVARVLTLGLRPARY